MKLTSELRQRYFDKHLKLAYSAASKYSNLPQDDARQVSALALWIATGRYDDSRSADFASYAYYIIKGALNKYSRREQVYHSRFIFGEEEDMSIEIADDVLNSLPEPMKTVAQMKIDGYSLREIGDSLNLSHTQVSRILTKAKQLLGDSK